MLRKGRPMGFGCEKPSRWRAACLTCLACLAALAGCASKTEIFTTDLTRQAGLYVVGYTTNPDLRRVFEDRLVADLTARGMIAYASYGDVPDLAVTSADDIIAAANRRAVVGVVLVNQATAERSGSPVQNPARVTPLHPDIQTFYRLSRDEMMDAPSGSEPVFAEVNLFLVDGSSTRLLWSGTTWSFYEGTQSSAVSQVSETIAEQLRRARDEFTGGTGPGQ